MKNTITTSIPDEIQKILSARHHDPFAFLGRHVRGDEEIVRAHIPGAGRVSLAAPDLPLARLYGTDLFEWRGKKGTLPERYRLVWTGNDGAATAAPRNDATPVVRTVHVVCDPVSHQTVDLNGDYIVTLSELLRPIQLYNSGGFHCADTPSDTEDGFVPGPGGNESCAPYDTDYNPQDWIISLSELLRVIQFYNSGGYHYCPANGTEDGFCPGL